VKYYNPFQNQELRVPDDYRKDAVDISQMRPEGGERPSPEMAPFARQVDAWFFSVCLGAYSNRRKEVASANSHRFNYGAVLEGDPVRIELLELLAISAAGDPFVVKEPKRVIEIANEFAAGGFGLLMEMLHSGSSKPIDNLSSDVVSKLAGQEHPSS
jgi:hypothetical protein